MEVSLALLDRLLAEFPTRFELQATHALRARCLAELGRDREAIAAFRGALEARRDMTGVETHAWLDFAWFAIQRERSDLYTEVAALLDEFGDGAAMPFPVLRYKFHGARAFVLAARGEVGAARQEAEAALAAAARTRSEAARHATLGLVDDSESATRRKLAKLTEG